MKNIEKRIKKIIFDKLDIKEEKITEDASFLKDLGADSLDIVELIMALEEEFNIEILDEEVEKMNTVQDYIEYIKNRLKNIKNEK